MLTQLIMYPIVCLWLESFFKSLFFTYHPSSSRVCRHPIQHLVLNLQIWNSLAVSSEKNFRTELTDPMRTLGGLGWDLMIWKKRWPRVSMRIWNTVTRTTAQIQPLQKLCLRICLSLYHTEILANITVKSLGFFSCVHVAPHSSAALFLCAPGPPSFDIACNCENQWNPTLTSTFKHLFIYSRTVFWLKFWANAQ